MGGVGGGGWEKLGSLGISCNGLYVRRNRYFSEAWIKVHSGRLVARNGYFTLLLIYLPM